MTDGIRIEVDRDVCIGAGNCVRLARGVFALDDDEIATVVEPAMADAETLRRAERSCPTGAIAVLPDLPTG
jgi:ferredoxin